MKNVLLVVVVCSLCVIACGQRVATISDAASTRDGKVLPRSEAGPFCSGGPKVSVNGTGLTVEQVLPETYVSAAHVEGARLKFQLAGQGADRWELSLTIDGLKTIIDKPMPRTVQMGTPDVLAETVMIERPPGCSTTTCLIKGFLTNLPYVSEDVFLGDLTLTGQDYRSHCQLQICLSATRKSTAFPQVDSVEIYTPPVTIPFWRVPGS